MSSSASRRALSPSGSTGTITPRNNGTSSSADTVPSPLPSHRQQGQGGGHHHKRHVSSTSITHAAQKIFRFSSPLIVFFVGNPESAVQAGGTPTSPGGLEPPMTQPEIEIVIKKMEKELHEVDASSLIMGSGGSLPGASVPLSFAKASTLYHHGGGALHVFLVYVPRRKSGGSSLAAARMKKAAALAKEWRDELFRTGATDSNLLIFFVHTDLIEAGQRATSTSNSNAASSETHHNGQRSGSTDDAASTATVLKSAASFFSRIGNSSTKSAVEEALESVQEYMDDFQKRIPNAPRMCVFHQSSYNARMLDLLKESYHEQALRLKAVRHQSHMSRSAPGWSLQEFWRKGFDLAVHHMRFGAMHEAISSFSAMFTEYFNHSDDFGFVSDWSFLRDVGQVANVLDPQRTSIKGAPTVMMRLGYPSSLSDSAEVIDGLLYIVGAEMTCALFLGNREGALARFVSFYEVVKEKFNECNRADAVIVQQERQQQMEAYKNAAAAASGGGGHSRMSSVSATTLSSAVHSASSSFDYSFSSFAAPQHGGDSGDGVFGVGHHANGTKRAAPPMYLQQFFSFRVVMSALDLCTGSNLAARIGSLVQERTGGGFMGIDGNTANASLQALGLPATTTSPIVAGGTPLRREVTTTFEGNDNEGAARNRNSRQQPQAQQAASGGIVDDSDEIDQFEYSIQSIDVNNFGWSATDDERVAQRQQLQAQQQQQLKDSSASTARSVSTRAQSHPSTAQREYERYCVVVGELCLCAREHLVALGDVCGFADPSEVSHLALTQLGHRTHSFSSLVSAATTAVGGAATTAPATPFMASGGNVVTIVDTTKFCVEDDRRRLGLECIRTQPRFHATYLSLTRVAASALRKGRRSKQSHSLMAQEAAALASALRKGRRRKCVTEGQKEQAEPLPHGAGSRCTGDDSP
ncbi:Hypothetical protein, putative [Bodo saltans]|uniref:Uncharacterized protein n=1 Tax=Bodo saltans TaxID=75058 RepID=A0A0S4IV48_BODSA|nr:Hypothetical protein, putative [Bodo saltans]|eukprot:CUF82255.1 Hypothetical protein, putative [Bodo saltans]